jgi:hypothetical protein
VPQRPSPDGLTHYLSISVAADGVTVNAISGPLVADVALAVTRKGYHQDQGTLLGSRASGTWLVVPTRVQAT